jgi:shikimate kinase
LTARLALVGAPGSGKTSIGRAVAQRWECGFVDSDEQYQAMTGTTVGEAVIDDEASFRKAEQQIVLEALGTAGVVVAVGSGAVHGDVAEALRSIPVVWLEVGLPDTARRTGLSGARPLSLGNVRGQLHEMLKARAEVYSQVADLVVKTDGRIVESVAEEIVGWETERDDH